MKFFLTYLILFFSFTINSFSRVIEYGSNNKSWQNVNWHNVKFYKGADGSIDASLAENQYSINDEDKVIVLHFNNENEIKKGNRIKNFVVDKTNISIDKRRFKFGNGAALFYKSSDTLRFALNRGMFFENHTDIGAFTIEFWAKPFSRNDREIIFQKYGPVYKNGRVSFYSGIRVYFYNGKLVWEFFNMFKEVSGRRYSVVRISSTKKIPLYKWGHYAVTYNPVNGKLTYYINGIAIKSIFCTDTGDADATILAPSFHRKEFGMFIIGKGYQGLIDEFAISRKVKHSFKLNKYVPRLGLIRSGIIDLNATGSIVKKIKVKYKSIRGADIVLEYRVSNTFFNSDKPETIFPWKEYNLQSPSDNRKIRGRYFQWRIKLLGSENGKYSPIIYKVKMIFSSDKAPFKPIGLVAVSYNKKIYLSWQGNTESDVVGYKIYYGRASGVYNGTLAMQGFSPIMVPISRIRNPLMPRFELNGLRVNGLYYITITAYDRSGQESPFAKEIYIRVKRFKRKTHRGIFNTDSREND